MLSISSFRSGGLTVAFALALAVGSGPSIAASQRAAPLSLRPLPSTTAVPPAPQGLRPLPQTKTAAPVQTPPPR